MSNERKQADTFTYARELRVWCEGNTGDIDVRQMNVVPGPEQRGSRTVLPAEPFEHELSFTIATKKATSVLPLDWIVLLCRVYLKADILTLVWKELVLMVFFQRGCFLHLSDHIFNTTKHSLFNTSLLYLLAYHYFRRGRQTQHVRWRRRNFTPTTRDFNATWTI